MKKTYCVEKIRLGRVFYPVKTFTNLKKAKSESWNWINGWKRYIRETTGERDYEGLKATIYYIDKFGLRRIVKEYK